MCAPTTTVLAFLAQHMQTVQRTGSEPCCLRVLSKNLGSVRYWAALADGWANHFEQVLSCYKWNRVKILHLKLQAIKGKYMLCKEYNFLHSSMKETLQGKLVHEIIQYLLHPIYGWVSTGRIYTLSACSSLLSLSVTAWLCTNEYKKYKRETTGNRFFSHIFTSSFSTVQELSEIKSKADIPWKLTFIL